MDENIEGGTEYTVLLSNAKELHKNLAREHSNMEIFCYAHAHTNWKAAKVFEQCLCIYVCVNPLKSPEGFCFESL